MKATYILVSLLPLLGHAASIEVRSEGNKLKSVPNLDGASISEEFLESTNVEVSSAGDLTTRACPISYPWACLGWCCPYNICCPASCCLPNTDFCYNGNCYRWAK